MVGICQDDLCISVSDILRIKCFDSSKRADRHEDRGVYPTMRCVKVAGSGVLFGVSEGEGEHGFRLVSCQLVGYWLIMICHLDRSREIRFKQY